MSIHAIRRSLTAFVIIAMTAGVFAAPHPQDTADSMIGGIMSALGVTDDPRPAQNNRVDPRPAQNNRVDLPPVSIPHKRSHDGEKKTHWPSNHKDCLAQGRYSKRGDDKRIDQLYDHDGKKYEGDCLLSLSLLVEFEERKDCKYDDGRLGYDNDCLMEFVVEVDVKIDIDEEQKKYDDEREKRRHWPERKSDCEDIDNLGWTPSSKGPNDERYDSDCMFQLSLRLDEDKKDECRPKDSDGPGYDSDCMIKLCMREEIDVDYEKEGNKRKHSQFDPNGSANTDTNTHDDDTNVNDENESDSNLNTDTGNTNAMDPDFANSNTASTNTADINSNAHDNFTPNTNTVNNFAANANPQSNTNTNFANSHHGHRDPLCILGMCLPEV